MRRYTVVLIPEPEEGGYSVLVPWLPGCVTQGETTEEAVANAREAITGYIEALEKHGETVPLERSAAEVAAIEV